MWRLAAVAAALLAVFAGAWLVFGPNAAPRVSGCSESAEQPIATAPPDTAQIEISWSAAQVPRQLRDADEEIMLDVAAFNGSFVAVGRESTGPRSRAFMVRSDDGRGAWTTIPGPDGWLDMEIASLEVVGDRLFGIGSATTDDRGGSRGVVMYSDDALTWHEANGQFAAARPYAIAGDASGLIVLGWANSDSTLRAWQSTDGADWEPLAVDLPVEQRFAGFGDIVRSEDGWLAVGSLSAGVDSPAAPVAWRSVDGRTWSCQLLDPARFEVVRPSVLHRSSAGWLAMGVASSVCGPAASCVGWPIAWTSADGVTWGPAFGDMEPMSIGGIAYAGGPHAFVGVGQGNTWVSGEGSSWTRAEIGETGHHLRGQADALAISADGGRVVAVGTEWIGATDVNPWIAVGVFEGD